MRSNKIFLANHKSHFWKSTCRSFTFYLMQNREAGGMFFVKLILFCFILRAQSIISILEIFLQAYYKYFLKNFRWKVKPKKISGNVGSATFSTSAQKVLGHCLKIGKASKNYVLRCSRGSKYGDCYGIRKKLVRNSEFWEFDNFKKLLVLSQIVIPCHKYVQPQV